MFNFVPKRKAMEKKPKIKHNYNMPKPLLLPTIVLCLISTFFLSLNSAHATNDPLTDHTSTFNQYKETEKQCKAGGSASWVICDTLEVISNTADSSDGILKYFFSVNHKNIINEESHTSWTKIRDLANTFLIFYFMVVIFSQLTGVGISNYGIKKTLPKFIVAVILINLSFIITQLLIDISNITGFAISGLFNSLKDTMKLQTSTVGTASGIALIIFSIPIVKTQTSLASLFISIVGTFAVVLIVTILFLVAREAIAIVLLAFAPIAFLTLIFPKTEGFYKTWKRGMTVVLVMYPVMATLFGAANLVSGLLANNQSFIFQLLSFVMRVLPFIFAPNLVKSSIASLPMIGSMIGNTLNKLQGAGINFAKNNKYSQFKRQQFANKKRAIQAGTFKGGKFDFLENKLSKFNKFINNNTNYGRARAYNLQQEDTNQVNSLSGGITSSDADTIQAAIDGGTVTTDADKKALFNSLSPQTRQAIAAQGLGVKDFDKIAMASSLNLSKTGKLNYDSYMNTTNMALKGKMGEGSINSLSEQIRLNSENSGRFDTASVIKGMQKNNLINNAFTGAPASHTIEDFMKDGLMQMNSDELSKINKDSLNNGSVGQSVFHNLYHSNPNFKNTVDSALNTNSTMSAETYNSIKNTI